MDPITESIAVPAVGGDGPVGADVAQLIGWLQDGGPILVILAVVSVLAVTLMLLKLQQFVHLRVGARDFVPVALALWRARRPAEALARLAASPSPVAAVLAAAIRGLGQGGGVPTAAVREEVLREAAAQQQRLARYARSLDLIATLAPLLGLLGTVLGMIDAFRALEVAGGRADPAVLAGGIWEALLTTAAGLAIAIPAAAAVHGIEAVVESVRHDAEDAVTRLFTGSFPGAASVALPSDATSDAPSHGSSAGPNAEPVYAD